jgi:hypothetical protein
MDEDCDQVLIELQLLDHQISQPLRLVRCWLIACKVLTWSGHESDYCLHQCILTSAHVSTNTRMKGREGRRPEKEKTGQIIRN